MEATDSGSEWRRVRVWFGEAVIAEHVGDDPVWADSWAEKMAIQFPPPYVVKNEALSGAVSLP